MTVLRIAGVVAWPDTAVVAVGEDDYGAAVTLAEERACGRPFLLSTVADGVPLGDVKGCRYVPG